MVLASFTRDGDRLVPSAASVSPWSPDMVNGHQIGGLIAWGALGECPDPDMQLTRLTVDMFRPVPMKPLEIRTEMVRDGRRIKLVEVGVFCDDVEVTRGTTLLLRRGEDPAVPEPWAKPHWDARPPEEFDSPHHAGTEMRAWEIRQEGGIYSDDRGRAWLRELAPFVEGEDLAPAMRACLAADFANPLTNGGSGGLAFINTDVTVYLARDPIGEWVGMESTGHVRDQGVAVGSATVYDLHGRIGEAVLAAIPNGQGLQGQRGRAE